MHPTFHTFAQAEETEADVVKPHQLLTLHVNLRLVRSLLHDGMGVTDIFFQTYTPTGISFSFPFSLSPFALQWHECIFLSKMFIFLQVHYAIELVPLSRKANYWAFQLTFLHPRSYFRTKIQGDGVSEKRRGTDRLFQTTRVAKIACCLGNLFQRRKAKMGIQDKSEGDRRAPLQPLPPLHAAFLNLLAPVSYVCLWDWRAKTARVLCMYAITFIFTSNAHAWCPRKPSKKRHWPATCVSVTANGESRKEGLGEAFFLAMSACFWPPERSLEGHLCVDLAGNFYALSTW